MTHRSRFWSRWKFLAVVVDDETRKVLAAFTNGDDPWVHSRGDYLAEMEHDGWIVERIPYPEEIICTLRAILETAERGPSRLILRPRVVSPERPCVRRFEGGDCERLLRLGPRWVVNGVFRYRFGPRESFVFVDDSSCEPMSGGTMPPY
jgi:hypothetical protein